MSFVLSLFLLGVLLLAVAGYRDLRALFAAQVAALAANLFLPFAPFGVPMTSQRLVALVVVGTCGLLFVRGRIAIPRPNVAQIGFILTYGILVILHALHLLRWSGQRPGASILGAVLNLLLFCLAITILHNVRGAKREALFSQWLPWVVLVVMVFLVGDWVQDMLSRPDLDVSRFRQGYRLRNASGRNIVNIWSASLVLTVSFVWQPLFTRERPSHKVVSLLAVGLTSLAIVLSFSRAALFALILLMLATVVLAILGWMSKLGTSTGVKGHRILASVVGVSALLAVIGWALEQAGLPVVGWIVERVEPMLTGTDPSLQARLDRYATTRELLEGLPVLGYGPGAQEIGRLPESTLIFTMLYFGPFALACWIGMLLLIGWSLVTWWWPRRGRTHAATWPAAYLAYVALLLSNDFLFFSMGTIFLATITAVATAQPWRRTRL